MQYNRSKSRIIIMTILYQIAAYEKNKMEYNIDNVINENMEIDNEFIKEAVYGIINNLEAIDELANKHLKNWTIDRLGKTDQAILRLGIYELIYTDTPDIICINEAIELAKVYSDDAVKDVINGVLDAIMKNR
ncbi:MAG: transcription antitermination factor NusB [Bacilli bacterium]|nr:transcription antitermination factor NusB [Mollicutes bacterium]